MGLHRRSRHHCLHHAQKVARVALKTPWNPAEFYRNPPDATATLQLLSRYFSLSPAHAERVVLAVKGRTNLTTLAEETIGAIAEYVKTGKIGGIGLSEASADSTRRAHAVHPIALVEVKFSLWSRQIFKNGVAATCYELGIPIVAYSPLDRGFLTGQLKSPMISPRVTFARFERFRSGNFEKNFVIVNARKALAAIGV
ncbi:Aldo/keto reductase [Choiromyces venosus 120613-1]|uniref:Aldo/keto reductase n=1 Tax=Choiromyces venosus 120613-1 TaxID=1336337 RepID=A0A3N4JDC0_9PEZI|nr:Aldo/keto reductase [Choiromyces venosus 120613-1]